MDGRQLAPLVGIVGCVTTVVVLAVPYGLVNSGAGTAIGTYYATGAVNPLIGGLFAAVSLIVLAAGREGRTDPVLAAGVALAFGVFQVLIATLWAVTVPADVVLGMSTNTAIEHHRWFLTAVSVSVPVSAGWYARSLGVL
jgi:hypothetical protein